MAPGSRNAGRMRPADAANLQAEMERVLSSASFRGSASVSTLLRELVALLLRDGPDGVKESRIGVAVFGRDPGYDTQIDPIVRVTARRLRAKLLAYYAAEGREGTGRIELPPGGYVLHYRRAAHEALGGGSLTSNAMQERDGHAAGSARATAGSEIRVLGSLTGKPAHPAFSPDGHAIALGWQSPADACPGIYVQLLSADGPARLSPPAASDFRPAWAADGRHIACLRATAPGKFEVRLLPVFGTGDRLLRTIWANEADPPRVDLAADGRLAVTSERLSVDGPAQLILIALESGASWRLESGLPASLSCGEAVFSPDSKTLAVRAGVSPLTQDIYILPLASGQRARRLSFDNCPLHGLAWDGGGQHVIAASLRRGSSPCLWSFPIENGAPERLTDMQEDCAWPAVTRSGGHLAYVRRTVDTGVWVLGTASGESQASLIVESPGQNLCPRFSPDGAQLAFASGRSGYEELWVCQPDGHALRQLSCVESSSLRAPHWSPDGRRLAFSAVRSGLSGVYVIPAEGGTATCLSSGACAEAFPDWSADGGSLYRASDRSGSWQIWRSPLEGGRAVRMTPGGGFVAAEAPGRDFLCFSKGPGQAGLWRVSVHGGAEEPLPVPLPGEMWGNWTIGRDGLYYLTLEAASQPPARLWFYDFTGAAPYQVARLHGLPPGGDSGLSVSPDGRRIAYSQVNRSAQDLVLRLGPG